MRDSDREAPPPDGPASGPADPDERAPSRPANTDLPPGPVLDFYLFEKAKAFQNAGNYPQAEQCYRQLIERDPRSVKAYNNLGIVFQAQKRMPEAEWAYRRALEIEPASAHALYNLAHALQSDGRLDEAEAYYGRVIALDPNAYSACFNLGRLFEAQHRLEEAARLYRRAVEIVPESTVAHVALGDALYQLRRLEEALAAFRAGIESDPASGAPHFGAGKALEALDRLDEAAADYRQAVERDPAAHVARENLVSVLERLGRRDEAVQALADWLLREPGHPIARHLLAAISGLEVPERAGDDYLRATFDSFAEDFDVTLERLGYRGPALLGAELARAGDPPRAALDVLDAGCGTGLCAATLRPYARRLTGVDVSRAMLARARARGLYDELAEREVTSYLEERPQAFDLIAAADTLIYFGPLERWLGAAARALRPAGRLLVTLELLEDGTGVPHRLNPTGRYAHAEVYALAALEAAGLPPAVVLREPLRSEAGGPVNGLVVLAQRAVTTD